VERASPRERAKTISSRSGHAFGGGIGLVAASDIAIAVHGAKFAFSEVRIGVIPAIISVVVLPKLGEHHAMRLFVTGERFSAAEAPIRDRRTVFRRRSVGVRAPSPRRRRS